MGLEAWIMLGVLTSVFGLLMFSRWAADAVLVGGVALLLLTGVIDAEQALEGMSNEGVITIGVLFVVAAGLRETGGLDWMMNRLLGRPHSERSAQARLMLPAAGLSAFVNNTPLVAMLIPVVKDWGRKLKIPASRLLLPLSVASILGGACTLIGTSTNLIVNGWLLSETELPALGMFQFAWVALPVAVVGIVYTVAFGRKLLPERGSAIDLREDPREYTVEMIVENGSPLSGRTIETAGLRHLPGLYLVEIERDGQVLPAVSANVALRDGDRLVFVGVIESVVDLKKIRGLNVADEQLYKLNVPHLNRKLIEAVVSDSCPLAGQTIREGAFRTRYRAVVIAVARNGERLFGKLGDIRLQAGDTLLLEARADFVRTMRDSRDFYLVSAVDGTSPPNHDKALLALSIVTIMVLVVSFQWLSMLKASLVAAGLMVTTRCCDLARARSAVDWQVLIVLAASLGLGKGIQISGLADIVADGLIVWVGDAPNVALAAIFGITMLLAGAITAKAAAVLVLPIALALSESMGLNFLPFVMTVTLAAATTIATPIGYPTNLMVMGPGGYRFRDYVVFGAPLTLLIWVIVVVLAPIIWPF
jgi:di/tricarboxylate transporter